MSEPQFVIEEVTDPADNERSRARRECHERNSRWLEAHWPDLLPQARGKFVAVAGQEAFLADNVEQAWAWAEVTHPEDDGAFVRFVFPGEGPRIYARRR